MAIFGFEAPSALLAAEQNVGAFPLTRYSFGQFDPRRPRRAVGVLAWKLVGERLVPGVPAPEESAAALVRPSQLPWSGREQARRDATRLASSTLDDLTLVALAVHPAPMPLALSPWEWIRRWQLVCCLALGQRHAVGTLLDLADGPEDWLSDVALAGLAEIAYDSPALRARVVRAVIDHVRVTAARTEGLNLPHFGNECEVAMTLPDLPSEDSEMLRAWRERWLRGGDRKS
jgi:hypothetical protein